MPITAQEKFRIDGTHVMLEFNRDGIIYERSVTLEEWSNDPQAVMANVADYLDNIPPEPPILDAIPGQLSMTEQEIQDKLAELQQ